MNIFVVDSDPAKAAKALCDKHVIKMILESGQLLSNCLDNGPYKRTHYNHPCSIWVRQSKKNFEWLVIHGLSLCKEYTSRYGKIHACQSKIEECLERISEINFPQKELTSFPQCMPAKYKSADAVASYREYYRKDKASFAKWKNSNVPDWMETL